MTQEPFEEQLDPELEAALGGENEELEGETIEELAALAEAEATAADAEQAAQAEELAVARRLLDAERAQTRAAVARYREAVLAAEPDLPPELVAGETLEELDGSLDAARRAVARSANASAAKTGRAAASPPARRPAAARRRPA